MFPRWGACFLVLVSLFSIESNASPREKGSGPKVLRIGIMASFYRDQSEEIVKTTVDSLKELMLAQTGFKGEPMKVESYDALGQELAKNKTQLGVFYGHEFGWIRKKYPSLRP